MLDIQKEEDADTGAWQGEVGGIRWLSCEVEMFHTHIFVCVGTRRQMFESGADALTKMGFEKSTVEDIGQSLAKEVPNLLDHPNVGECAVVRTDHSGTVHFIRLDRLEPRNGKDILVLSHECLHAAMNILDTCGVRETGNNECLCYLHEFVFGAFLFEACKEAEPAKSANVRKEATALSVPTPVQGQPAREEAPSPYDTDGDDIVSKFCKDHFFDGFYPGLREPFGDRICSNCINYSKDSRVWACRHPDLWTEDELGKPICHPLYCDGRSICQAFSHRNKSKAKETDNAKKS